MSNAISYWPFLPVLPLVLVVGIEVACELPLRVMPPPLELVGLPLLVLRLPLLLFAPSFASPPFLLLLSSGLLALCATAELPCCAGASPACATSEFPCCAWAAAELPGCASLLAA